MLNLHYVAGLFDGEGYVYIFKKQIGSKPNHIGYYLSTGIGMCYYPIIEAIHKQFGGHLNGNGAELRSPNNRPHFVWGAANQVAANFLRQIRPYLIVKAEEVDLGLKLQDHIDQNRYVSPGRNHMTERFNRDEILAHRENLMQQCKSLKSRAFAPLLTKGPGLNGRSRGRPKNR